MRVRADSFFTNLTKRQSMLLLTAVTFGGAEGVAALAHLSEEEEELLGERAGQLMSVPRDRRVPFLVQEIKRLVVGRKGGGELRGASAEQVIALLREERPSLAAVVLRALPGPLAEPVREELGLQSRKALREVKPEVLAVLRFHLERRLHSLSPRGAQFLMADVIGLSARDLLTLADHLGGDELGPALAGISPGARDAILKELPAEQRAVVQRGLRRAAGRPMSESEAELVVDEQVGDDPRHAVRRAGLRRLVRACLAESGEFASRLAERHRDELGRMVVHAIRLERGAGFSRDGNRLTAEVLEKLEQLAEQGLVERPVRLPPPPVKKSPTPPPPPAPAPAARTSRPAQPAVAPPVVAPAEEPPPDRRPPPLPPRPSRSALPQTPAPQTEAVEPPPEVESRPPPLAQRPRTGMRATGRPEGMRRPPPVEPAAPREAPREPPPEVAPWEAPPGRVSREQPRARPPEPSGGGPRLRRPERVELQAVQQPAVEDEEHEPTGANPPPSIEPEPPARPVRPRAAPLPVPPPPARFRPRAPPPPAEPPEPPAERPRRIQVGGAAAEPPRIPPRRPSRPPPPRDSDDD